MCFPSFQNDMSTNYSLFKTAQSFPNNNQPHVPVCYYNCRFQGCSWLGYNSLSLKTGGRGFSSTTIIYVLPSSHHTILDKSQCIDILFLKVGTEEPNLSCTKCPPGYYSKIGGAFNCTACSYFEYQSKEGRKKVCCLFVSLALSLLQVFRHVSYVKCTTMVGWELYSFEVLGHLRGMKMLSWLTGMLQSSVWLKLPCYELLYLKWYIHHECIIHYSYIGEVEIPFI